MRSVLIRFLARARFVLTGLYLVVAGGFLLAAPGARWSWAIIAMGGVLCLLLWWFVGVARREQPDGQSDDADGTHHG